MIEPAFSRRQSPDWSGLSREFRRGGRIEPSRYLPDHDIAGFPPGIDRAIEQWNDRYRIDYFTARAVLAELSARNVASIAASKAYTYAQREQILEDAKRERFVLFFHDDDDFFAADLPARIATVTEGVDVHVFPLFRVHSELFTFVRDGQPADFVWGARKNFDFRFQSNNYGIESRILTGELLARMKDHVDASHYADAARLSEATYAFPVSATVKTPCSASHLSRLLESPRHFDREMKAFARRFTRPGLPAGYEWLERPLVSIARLFDATVNRRRYADLPADVIELLG